MNIKETCSTLLEKYLKNNSNIYNVEKLKFINVGKTMFIIYQLLLKII